MSTADGGFVHRNAFGEMRRRSGADSNLWSTAGGPRALRKAMCREMRGRPAHDHARDAVHDLRHSYASALIAANVNPKVVQPGSATRKLAETMDTYADLFQDTEDLGSLAVDSALADALAVQRRNMALSEACDA
jgi:hypothetical protein